MSIPDIDITKLPEVYQTLAELVGVENMLKIAEVFGGGESIYFPKNESIHRISRNRKIIKEFDGYNYKQLAKKFNITEMAIRSIIKKYNHSIE